MNMWGLIQQKHQAECEPELVGKVEVDCDAKSNGIIGKPGKPGCARFFDHTRNCVAVLMPGSWKFLEVGLPQTGQERWRIMNHAPCFSENHGR